MSNELMGWVGFNLIVVIMLALDLLVFQRKVHEIKIREALGWSAFWIALALIFNAGVYYYKGREIALQFLTGYLIEKSLSVDNLFVFLLIFTYFRVPAKYQHHILFWGILGALIFRGLFIWAGVKLLHHFHWMFYVFGAFLIFTGIKLALEKDKEIHPEKNVILKLFKRLIPCTHEYDEGKFFTKKFGNVCATPLFIVLLVVETTDIIFAIDSIPAIFAVTTDPFIVYTSNVFAILGLRALYFALAGLMQIFHHLHYGLAFILVFVGVKMCISDFFKIPIGAALGTIAATLVISVIASIISPQKIKEIKSLADE